MTHEAKQRVLRAEYVSRINRVMDFVERNLDQELTRDRLAKIAGFSPYHFHRIFRSLVGETLNQLVQRIRIEKAATLLIRDPMMSVTEVALDCGYSSSAAFARFQTFHLTT